MYRNMVTSLMVHGRIRTTEAKAKELRGIADRVITLGKRVPLSSLDTLKGSELDSARAKRIHNIRRARKWIHDKAAFGKVFSEYAELFKERPGGYTRIYKVGFRPGDNAPMASIELVGLFDAPEKPARHVKEEVEVAATPVEETVEAVADDASSEVETGASEEIAAEESEEEAVTEE
jgi:large subunit ribosomal protein L17